MAYGDTTYYVYILSSPLDQSVFYVGVTSHLKNRRRQHFNKFSMRFNGMPPVFTVIDVIKCLSIYKGLMLEHYWINHYKHNGAELVNRNNTKHKYFNMDYTQYLTEIKKSNVLNYRKLLKGTTNVLTQ